MEIDEAAEALERVVREMDPTGRDALAQVLSRDDKERAAFIGQLHAAGSAENLKEILIDVHDRDWIRNALISEIRAAQIREGSRQP